VCVSHTETTNNQHGGLSVGHSEPRRKYEPIAFKRGRGKDEKRERLKKEGGGKVLSPL
jgi:hypothetical protein